MFKGQSYRPPSHRHQAGTWAAAALCCLLLLSVRAVAQPAPLMVPANFCMGPAPDSINAGHIPSENTRRTENFFEVGGAFGLPTVVNIVAGYHFNRDGVRLMGMHWGVAYGWEAEYMRTLSPPEEPVAHRLFAGVGSFNVVAFRWLYLAAGYSINAYGFHGSIGAMASTGSTVNPLLTFQLGYVHEFR